MSQFLNLKLALSALVILAGCQEPGHSPASNATPAGVKPKLTSKQLERQDEDSLVVISLAGDTGQTVAGYERMQRERLKKLLTATKVLERMERVEARARAEAEWVSLRPYLVLSESDPDQLSLEVSARLRQGYLLRGRMYMQQKPMPGIGQQEEHRLMYVQNMILLDSLRFKVPNGYRTRVEE